MRFVCSWSLYIACLVSFGIWKLDNTQRLGLAIYPSGRSSCVEQKGGKYDRWRMDMMGGILVFRAYVYLIVSVVAIYFSRTGAE